MTVSLPASPYLGMKSFRYADRHIYGGRDLEIEKIYKLLLLYRGLLIFGNSGVGKSSLVSAGLLTKLLERKFNPEIIRLNPEVDCTFVINRIKLSEDENQYHASLFDEFAEQNEHNDKINVSFSKFGEKVLELQTKENDNDAPSVSILIFDQFEELISLFEERQRKESTKHKSLNLEERTLLQDRIIEFFTKCYFQSNLPIKLIFVFREDYLARFGKLFNLIPDLKDHYLRIKPLQSPLLRTIISRPFDTEEKRKFFSNPFSEALIDNLEKKILPRYPEGNLVLAEIQIICQQLYNLSPEAREVILSQEGGINQLLESFYLELLNKVDKDKRPLAIDILFLLVLNDTTRNILHENAIMEELKNYDRAKVTEVIEILETKTQIIRSENRPGGRYLEIVSEVIIPYINKKKIEKEYGIKERENTKITLVWLATIGILIIGLFLFLNYLNYSDAKEALRLTQEADIKILYWEIINKSKRTSTPEDEQLLRKRDSISINKSEPFQFQAIELYKRAIKLSPHNLIGVPESKLIMAYIQARSFDSAVNSFKNKIANDNNSVIFFQQLISKIDEETLNDRFRNETHGEVDLRTPYQAKKEILKIAFENALKEDQAYLKFLAKILYDNKLDSLCFQTLLSVTTHDEWSAVALGSFYENGFREDSLGRRLGKRIVNIENAKKIYRDNMHLNEILFRVKLIGILLSQGKDNEAYQNLEKIEADHDYLVYDLGFSYFTNGNENLALKIFERIYDQYQTNEVFLFYLGSAYARVRKYREAFKVYDKALEIDPNHPMILNGYAWWLTKSSKKPEDLEKALRMSDQSIEMAKCDGIENKANYSDTRAEILFQLARYDEASVENENATQLIKNSDQSLIFLELRNGVEERSKKLKNILKPAEVLAEPIK